MYDSTRNVTITYDEIWAGYAVTGSDFTYVSGSWTVTEPDCSKTRNSWSSEWVGIDGFLSDTVEQIGTDTDCFGDKPYYWVWYEFYPLGNVILTKEVSIAPGDRFLASVTYDGDNEYTVAIKNDTTGESFSRKVEFKGAYGSGMPQRISAEWIMEMDSGDKSNDLTDFGTDSFGQYYTGVSGGADTATDSSASGVITDFGNAVYELITTRRGSNGSPKTAVPSALAPDDSSFKVTWKSE